MKYGSLFTGAGGLDLAVHMLWPDAELAWWSEYDQAASASFARHTAAPNLGDVTGIDWHDVEPVDLIVGGFPCQDLSHAGNRAGLSGDRSGLFFRMADAIDVLRPSLVLMENVAGIYTATGGDTDEAVDLDRDVLDAGPADAAGALGTVLGTLADLGFDAEWGMLRAADAGAPHHRRRWFCVAWSGLGAADPDGVRPVDRRAGELAAGTEQPSQPDAARSGREAAADPGGVGGHEAVEHDGHGTAAADRPSVPDERDRGPVRPRPGDGSGTSRGLTLLPTPTAVDMGNNKTPDEWDEWTAKMRDAHGNGNGHGKSLSIEAMRLLPTPEASRTGSTPDSHLSRKPGRNDVTSLDIAAENPDHPGVRWGEYADAIARWEDVFGTPAPAPTDDDGRLSPAFTEWMMGWPAGWTDGSRSARLKMCGNGVVPLQAAVAYAQLLHRLTADTQSAPAADGGRS